MCLAFLSWRPGTDRPVVLLSNRDEFLSRDTLPAHPWAGRPIVAGRDVAGKGGTWLGVNGCRWAAVLNVREHSVDVHGDRSRGLLVAHYLDSDVDPRDYVDGIDPGSYRRGFTLVVGDTEHALVVSNRPVSVRQLDPGFHGFANGWALGEDWPNVRCGLPGFERLVTEDASDDALLAFMLDQTRHSDDLPETPYGEFEHHLSSRCVVTPVYGTRATTLVRVETDIETTLLVEQMVTIGEPAGPPRELVSFFTLPTRHQFSDTTD